MSAKTIKMASFFISHLPTNSELISLVRRCDHIAASLDLQSHYFSWHRRKTLETWFKDLVSVKNR